MLLVLFFEDAMEFRAMRCGAAINLGVTLIKGRGARQQTRCDTAVVMHEGVLARFDADFAARIADERFAVIDLVIRAGFVFHALAALRRRMPPEVTWTEPQGGFSLLLTLPPELELLASPLVIGVAGLLCLVEFFADKIPYIDSINDALHTFVRVPAGALLAFGAGDQFGPEAAIVLGLLGGTLAAGSHIAKTGSRAAINASPEPFSNIAASVATDGLVVGGLLIALTHPITFLCLLALFVALLVWALPKLFRLAMVPFRRRSR